MWLCHLLHGLSTLKLDRSPFNDKSVGVCVRARFSSPGDARHRMPRRHTPTSPHTVHGSHGDKRTKALAGRKSPIVSSGMPAAGAASACIAIDRPNGEGSTGRRREGRDGLAGSPSNKTGPPRIASHLGSTGEGWFVCLLLLLLLQWFGDAMHEVDGFYFFPEPCVSYRIVPQLFTHESS